MTPLTRQEARAAVRIELPFPPSDLTPHAKGNWKADDDAELARLHGTMTIKGVANALGRTPASVRARVTRLGLSKQNLWTDAEIAILRERYLNAGADGVLNLPEIVSLTGRSKPEICRKAKELGLPISQSRRLVEKRKERRKFQTKEELSQHTSARMKKFIRENGHVKGMLGKRHSDETRAEISMHSRKRWAGMTEDQQRAFTEKAMKAKIAKHGSLAPNVSRGSWKAGWREIGGKRNYYRSRWEANYARYLQWLKERGEILEWEHEPETFWFDTIKRGTRSYLPDFRVWELNGSTSLHEVKGWMDSRSKTTLKRMAKYHPGQTIILIDGRQYRSIRAKVMGLIEGWEDSGRDNRE